MLYNIVNRKMPSDSLKKIKFLSRCYFKYDLNIYIHILQLVTLKIINLPENFQCFKRWRDGRTFYHVSLGQELVSEIKFFWLFSVNVHICNRSIYKTSRFNFPSHCSQIIIQIANLSFMSLSLLNDRTRIEPKRIP